MSFVAKLSLGSIPAYTWWRLRGRRHRANLKLAGGPRLQFRAKTANENDYGTAYEVFVHRLYELPDVFPDPNDVRLVVDLGSNVGFTCLHWLMAYPSSRVIAYEPHPAHVSQCRINLALNGWETRTQLHPAAAGTRAGCARLSDAGTSSALQDGELPGLEVVVEDFFDQTGQQKIDILKMDIEGGEYPLLEDHRFQNLAIRTLVMEWHRLKGHSFDEAWCRARLDKMGFETTTIFDAGTHGMLRSYRRK